MDFDDQPMHSRSDGPWHLQKTRSHGLALMQSVASGKGEMSLLK